MSVKTVKSCRNHLLVCLAVGMPLLGLLLLPSYASQTTIAGNDAVSRGRGGNNGGGSAGPVAKDPGVRTGVPGAGDAIQGLTDYQQAFFAAALDTFSEVDGVAAGLGPRFNGNSCAGCHAQPAAGGTSPSVNPQVALANLDGANNILPSFITLNGPVREARFVKNPDGTPDGGVHALFTIAGRTDAPGCKLAQDNFESQVANHNVIFRIPTPVFGGGLIEGILDADIVANAMADAANKANLGIRGHTNRVQVGRANGRTGISGQENRSGNDGTITRFGWKAQNKSLLIFAGEAYNVEQGVTNELFQNERDETKGCLFNPTPESGTNFGETATTAFASDPERFATFMRFLAPPTPAPDNSAQGIPEGRGLFTSIGCALCHHPSFTTKASYVEALSNKPVNLYSDLLVHDMGPGLADGVSQGNANGNEFRTAPLWGLGQRIFFLHDGRTSDLVAAIQAHQSGGGSGRPASEANAVIDNYKRLTEAQQQHLLNFLRSL